MHRFRVLAVVSSLSVFALVAGACSSDSDGGGSDEPRGEPSVALEDQTLVFGDFGPYTPKGFLEDFTARPVSTFRSRSSPRTRTCRASCRPPMARATTSVMATGNYLQTLINAGWAADSITLRSRTSNLYPEATELAFDAEHLLVPYTWGTTGLCYRPDLVDTEIDSSDDLLNPAADLEGKVTMLGTERWLLQPALLSLGYSINTEDPARSMRRSS